MFDNNLIPPNQGGASSNVNPANLQPNATVGSAEDIFAQLEQAPAPQQAVSRPAQPQPQSQPMQNAQQTPVMGQPSPYAGQPGSAFHSASPYGQAPGMQLPSHSNNSLKYLLIGIGTLVVLLGLGFYVYQQVLLPNFANNKQITPTTTANTTGYQEETYPAQATTSNPIIASTSSSDLANAVSSTIATTTYPNNDLLVITPATTSVPAVPVSAQDNSDNDKDGLIYLEEMKAKTDPNLADTDKDGLNDGQEVNVYKTDPLSPDTDGDTYFDGKEVDSGYDPKGSGKLPYKP
jgi:hypothetical protein